MNKSKFSKFLPDLVYGGMDGIVTTFAVVAGFIGANSEDSKLELTFLTVLLFGLANLFADATSMGLGDFLSVRAEQDHYQTEFENTKHQITNSKEEYIQKTKELLTLQGFGDIEAKAVADNYSNNLDYWARFILREEKKMPDTVHENPIKKGLATFISFLIFGTIPLLPYILLGDNKITSFLSIGLTILALFLLGVLRWYVSKTSLKRSLMEIVLIGGIAAIFAFGVGLLFK